MKRIEIAGTVFDVDGVGHFFEHMPEGPYNDPNITLIRRLFPKHGTFYDIGANVGLVSLGLSDLAELVVAVEPSSETFERLTRNTSGLAVKPVRALIGSGGEQRIFLNNTADPTGSTSLLPGQAAMEGHDYLKPEILVTLSLDQLVEEHGPPAFIKIDVEGAEVSVLASGKGALQKYEPTCLIEFNAFTLMNFGRINPPDALMHIKSFFPYVYRVSGSQIIPVEDNYTFIAEHVLHNGCVDDLLCSFRGIELK